METITIFGSESGSAPVHVPDFAVATLRVSHKGGNETIVVVFKTRRDEHTFAALERAMRDLDMPREKFEPTSFLPIGYVNGGANDEYGVISLDASADGTLRLNRSQTSKSCNGDSLTTPAGLIKKRLNKNVSASKEEAERTEQVE